MFLYFEVKKFKAVLKAKSAVSRLVRICLAQPGYGSGLLPPVYLNFSSTSISFSFQINYLSVL